LVANRIGLQEPSNRGRVHPGFVVVQVQRSQQLLAGVAEPDAGGGIGFAVRAVAQGGGTGAGTVGGGDDAALVVAVQPGFVGGDGAFVPD